MKKYKRIYIEITNVCNLSCEFCPKTKRRPAFMSVEDFRTILEKINGFTDHIYLHVLGEPLLHPKLEELLAQCSEYGLNVNLTTNGTLIAKQSQILLNSKALRQVNFSLHSFDANEKLDTVENYINHVLNFVEAASTTSNIICSLRLWNLLESDSPFGSLVNESDIERNEAILNLVEEKLNLNYKIKDRFADNRRLKLAHNIYLNGASRFRWPDINENESDNCGFCHGLRDQLGILADGTVVPCCLDGESTINLGNILHQSLTDIIAGERAKRMYDGFSERLIVEELCRKCDYRRRFTR